MTPTEVPQKSNKYPRNRPPDMAAMSPVTMAMMKKVNTELTM